MKTSRITHMEYRFSLHTTDTHGWLEGHIKEKNYGADWGDYVSFVKDMRQQADDMGVDLLLVDTGVRSVLTADIAYASQTSQ